MDNLLDRLQRVLGDAYAVERELTAGGMSRIFVATERSLNRQVVIKVLTPDTAGNVSELRFKREAELLARLQHPHIVPLLGFGSDQGLLWFSMPYVRGETLRERLARDGALPVAEGVSLLREVADALAYAHRNGVIHRDIKPSNILLGDGHAVLGDFGIAGSESSTSRLTSTGAAIGTVGYMAPEQLVGGDAVDARADVYALGVLGYELLTGRSPFATASGSGGGAAGAPQLRGLPAAPEKIRAGIPVAVGSALLRAMEPMPENRFATAAEFRDALGGVAPRLTPRRVAAGAALIALVIAVGLVLRARGASGPDRNLVAVAPFEVLRPDLQLWREGLVDVLSRNLDGMGDLRTVAPTTVLHAWHGRADPSSAQMLGEGTHARFVVYGTLGGDGDTARASATVYDIVRHRPAAEVERRDAIDHIDRLIDSLTLAVAREIPGAAGAPGAQLRPLGTKSLPAVKEFLQGEQAFRRSSWDSAATHFARAIQLDTGFALAYRRRGNALEWTIEDWDPRLREMALGAAARNHGLSAHDSLLIVVDSLRIALYHWLADEERLLTRLVQVSREVTERFPGDGQGWYDYGYVLFRFPAKVSGYPTAEKNIAAFDRAIEADSGLLGAYVYAGTLALMEQDVVRARRYASAALRIAPEGRVASGLRFVLPLLDRGAAIENLCASRGETFSPKEVSDAGDDYLFFWVDADGTTARCRAAMADRMLARHLPDTNLTRAMGYFTANFLRARGQLARASVYDPLAGEGGGSADLADLAMIGLANADSAHTRIRAQVRDSLFDWQLFPRYSEFLAWRGDTASLRAARAVLKPPPQSAKRANVARALHAWEAHYDAFIALARSDTAGAIRAFEATPYINQYLEYSSRIEPLSRLYEATGRVREAFTILRAHDFWFGASHTGAVLNHLRLARIADRLGEREVAAKAFAFVVDAWRDADPEFKSIYQEALDGLRRNGGDVADRQVKLKR